MRALVFLLVVANLLFLAWERGYFGDASTVGRAQRQQVMADRMSIVARDEPPGTPTETPEKKQPEQGTQELDSQKGRESQEIPAKPAEGDPVESAPGKDEKPDVEKTETGKSETAEKTEKPVSQACLMLNDLSADELARITEMTNSHFRDFRADRRSFAGSRSYWVFIPPLPSRQEAERRSEALKQAKAPEFFIVQDPPAMRFAISLGVFSTREAAEERLIDLRLKGIDAAQVGERETRPAAYQLELRGPQSRASALRQAVASVLPKARLAVCKAK